MLTAYQAETVAFLGEGELLCPDCAEPGMEGLSRFTVETDFPEGAYCGACLRELAAPDPDYCPVHQGWRVVRAEARCEYGDRDGECRFPAV